MIALLIHPGGFFTIFPLGESLGDIIEIQPLDYIEDDVDGMGIHTVSIEDVEVEFPVESGSELDSWLSLGYRSWLWLDDDGNLCWTKSNYEGKISV